MDVLISIIFPKIASVSKIIEKPLQNKLFPFSKENTVLLLKNELFFTLVSTFLPNIKKSRALWKKMIYIRKTCVLTFNKKNKIFFQNPIPNKFNGGGKSKTDKIEYFFVLTEISGRIFGRKFWKSAESKFCAKIITTFRGFEFGPKEKKLCHFKVSGCKIFKKCVYPPHWKWRGSTWQLLFGMIKKHVYFAILQN